MERVGIDDETVEGFVHNVFLGLVGFNTSLHTQTYTTGFTAGGITVMLDIEFKLEVLVATVSKLKIIIIKENITAHLFWNN
jgi:hypothetical protein